jgi:hypothetical protein
VRCPKCDRPDGPHGILRCKHCGWRAGWPNVRRHPAEARAVAQQVRRIVGPGLDLRGMVIADALIELAELVAELADDVD